MFIRHFKMQENEHCVYYPMITTARDIEHEVKLSGYSLNAEDIAAALSNKPSLKEINLTNVILRDDGMVLISKVLTNNHDLETINLNATEIGAHQYGIDALCNLLSHNPRLKSLSIAFNLFDREGILVIENALKNCPMIEKFFVSSPNQEVILE